MKRCRSNLCLCLLLFLSFGVAHILATIAEIEGSWTARKIDGKIRMRLTVLKDDDSFGEWNSSSILDRNDLP
ncbi:MAG: hypothetical protein ABIL68_12465, partial [bacterium]